MAGAKRVRRSIRELSLMENKAELDKIIRAFRGVQALDPTDWNSYFKIAGYHGEPFAAPAAGWGGYCCHDCILFPTWHRAYCLRFENALRTIEGCEDVALPYWDEYAEVGSDYPVPPTLTSPTYSLDNKTISNPLYSYKLQQAIATEGSTYAKDINYSTVRFPLSGLVGTQQARDSTQLWNNNAKWDTPEKQAEKLNWNFRNWLSDKGIELAKHEFTNPTDTYSTAARLRKCMEAPNWTVFSNKESASEWARQRGTRSFDRSKPLDDDQWVVSLEEPHNAIHLGLGGHFQKGTDKDHPGYNADPKDYEGANGDMGCNELAAFDPIFFLHHAFIDYTMWKWQERNNLTKPGSLTIDPTIERGVLLRKGEGNAAVPERTRLTMSTPLKPFTRDNKPDSTDYWTSDDLTNIEDLGYSYAPGSWDFMPVFPEPAKIVAVTPTPKVDRSRISGSFVIRTYATINGEKVEIGRDPILSRYNVNACENCQNSLEVSGLVPIEQGLANILDTVDGDDGEQRLNLTAEVQHLGGQAQLVEDDFHVDFRCPVEK